MLDTEDFHRREQALNTALALAAIQNSDETTKQDSQNLIAALAKPVKMAGDDESPRSSGSYISMFDIMPPNVTRSVVGHN